MPDSTKKFIYSSTEEFVREVRASSERAYQHDYGTDRFIQEIRRRYIQQETITNPEPKIGQIKQFWSKLRGFL